MWLLRYFIKKSADATLKSRVALSSKWNNRKKEGTLTSYRQVANYLLETYGTDDVIPKLDDEILHYTQRQIWRQQSIQKRFEIRHSAGIPFMTSRSLTENSSRGSADEFDIACAHIRA